MEPFPEIKNIHAIPIELPGYADLKTANIYLVGSEEITMIDTGPKFPGSVELVEDQLNNYGYSFTDIERILITHGHIDHFGQAVKFREHAKKNIECYIHEEDTWRINSDFFNDEMLDDEARDLLNMVDLPEKEIERIMTRFSFFKYLADPLDDVSIMKEGDIFSGDGYEIQVIHTPGHSPGSCCFYEKNSKILFSGDIIIKHITPNPLYEARRSRLSDPNYKSLEAYVKSLKKLSELDCSYVFPGHWEYVSDLQKIIKTYRFHHRERMDLIWKALKKESRPIFQLIDDVFEFVPEDDVFLAVSEILVHLEIMQLEGRVELADPGPPAYYIAT